MHLVPSSLTSMPISLLAINKASVFLFITPHSNISVNQVKKIYMGGTCSTYGAWTGVYRVLKERSEGKREVRRKCRWEDNTKRNLQEVGGHGGD